MKAPVMIAALLALTTACHNDGLMNATPNPPAKKKAPANSPCYWPPSPADVICGETPATKGLWLYDEIAVKADSVWLNCRIISISVYGDLAAYCADRETYILYRPHTRPLPGMKADSLNKTYKTHENDTLHIEK